MVGVVKATGCVASVVTVRVVGAVSDVRLAPIAPFRVPLVSETLSPAAKASGDPVLSGYSIDKVAAAAAAVDVGAAIAVIGSVFGEPAGLFEALLFIDSTSRGILSTLTTGLVLPFRNRDDILTLPVPADCELVKRAKPAPCFKLALVGGLLEPSPLLRLATGSDNVLASSELRAADVATCSLLTEAGMVTGPWRISEKTKTADLAGYHHHCKSP